MSVEEDYAAPFIAFLLEMFKGRPLATVCDLILQFYGTYNYA